jgi:hypothetical protein
MSMSMMNIGKVRVPMAQPAVRMLVSVRLPPVPLEVMLVPMMLVMHMSMCVRKRLVDMLVLVALGNMQPNTERHTRRRQPESDSTRLSIEQHRGRGTNERRGGKIGTGARRPELTQSDNKQYQAQAVPEESDQQRCEYM